MAAVRRAGRRIGEFGGRCERTGAGLTVLTHLDKSLDYATLSAETPDNVLVGYDGMEIDLG